MVHMSVGYARQKDRLETFAVTASVGPGAANMLTGAALATVNRIPVLLLPADIFATRVSSPVLQELEQPYGYDVSVNDAFRPLSKFFDRVWRAEQLPAALLGAMRVLTDPAETGAATISLPEDVQAEAFDWPVELFAERTWRIGRPLAEPEVIAAAAEIIRGAKRPMIVAGGGVTYAEANEELRAFVEATGIPIGETQAGKGFAGLRPPAEHRGDRGDRNDGGERDRRRRRRHRRNRHPLLGFHHGLANGVPAPGREVRQHQRGGSGRGQARRAAGRR